MCAELFSILYICVSVATFLLPGNMEDGKNFKKRI
jgi:hypothetical protein